MKASNREFLDHHRSIYETLVKAEFVQNLTNEVRQTLLNVVREEFSPGYLCCLHCGADIAALIRYAYIQYDEYLKTGIDKDVIVGKKTKKKNETK
jgi:hypothetical protein